MQHFWTCLNSSQYSNINFWYYQISTVISLSDYTCLGSHFLVHNLYYSVKFYTRKLFAPQRLIWLFCFGCLQGGYNEYERLKKDRRSLIKDCISTQWDAKDEHCSVPNGISWNRTSFYLVGSTEYFVSPCFWFSSMTRSEMILFVAWWNIMKVSKFAATMWEEFLPPFLRWYRCCHCFVVPIDYSAWLCLWIKYKFLKLSRHSCAKLQVYLHRVHFCDGN